MLSGADISDQQGSIDWSTFKNNINFVLMKMSEGNGYIDTWVGNNRQQARNFSVPRGFYHFARPDLGNAPADEATFFINLVKGGQLLVGESIYLDYEVQFNGGAVAWVLAWMQQVEQELGVKPVFYTYQSMTTAYDWTAVVNNGNALWIAAPLNPGESPNNENPTFTTGKWADASFRQWGAQTIPGVTGQCDSDVFYGDSTEFLKFGLPAPTPPPPNPCEELQTKLTTLQNQFNSYIATHPDAVSSTPVSSVTTTQGTTLAGSTDQGATQVPPTMSTLEKFWEWISTQGW